MSKCSRLMVQGKPFFSLGGQTHNSTSYVLSDMTRAWQSVKAMGGNTVATPVPWDAFEPVEGQFNETFVTDLIDEARRQGLKLSLLWFATWKNGTMEYCPAWVKRDTARFQRVLLKDGLAIHQLSAHCPANWEADGRAFEKLMQVVRDYDQDEQTVIAVQIENEPGILGGTRRDFSPLGQAAYEADVPAHLIQYAKDHPGSILARKWIKAGSQDAGPWGEVFGRYGAEAVTAYAIARYIDGIAQKGKAVYGDLFMYMNVWMDGCSRGRGTNLAGIDWPSGGAIIGNLDIYYATCVALDAISPDNYKLDLQRHKEVTDAYAHPEIGFPLYVPESSSANMNAGQAFYAVAEKGAIGYHIFGCESCLEDDGVTLRDKAVPMMHTMKMLSAVEPLLFQYQGTDDIHSIVQLVGEREGVLEELKGDWKATYSFIKPGDGWSAMDFRHRDAIQEEGVGVNDTEVEKGRALIFQAGGNEFYVVGHKCRITFNHYEPDDGSIPAVFASPILQPTNVNYIEVTEGHFDEGGRYVVDRVRSGDEVRHGIWCQYDCGVIHIVLD